jgi:sugar O-acyltransferase (sialic acid O-acetyltransferase NeuD family)
MLEDLILVGAGGASRAIAWAVEDINRIEPRWRLLGFLDDDPTRHGQLVDGYPVLGPLSSAMAYPFCRFLIGIANHHQPPVRKSVVERLGLGPERFATLVHPSACVSRHATLGAGTAVLTNVAVDPGVAVGNHVIVTHQCGLGHDATVGDYVTMAPQVRLSGSVRVGAGAYLGAGCAILQGVKVGECALVGIGSVVLRDVPAHITVFGNPAKPRRGPRHR